MQPQRLGSAILLNGANTDFEITDGSEFTAIKVETATKTYSLDVQKTVAILRHAAMVAVAQYDMIITPRRDSGNSQMNSDFSLHILDNDFGL